MTDEQKAEKALVMAEMAAQDMADAGLDAKWIAIGLAAEMNRQVDLAMPTKTTATAFKMSLIS